MRRLIPLLFIPAALATACNESVQDRSNTVIPAPADPDVYPEAAFVCDGRVYPEGSETHLTWSAYSTNDAPTEVVKFYEGVLSPDNHEQDGDDHIWRMPKEEPRRVISVEPPGSRDGVPYSDCDIPDDARTIILISEWLR